MAAPREESTIRVAGGLDGPDVAVIDLTMPGLSGVETLEHLHRKLPATRVLVLTMHDDPAYARVARAAGASGYVIKDSESSELLAAICAVHRGRAFVQVGADAGSAPPAAQSARVPALSQRERQVLQMLARGYTNREIATTCR
jgi:two-component system, NarL family, response regulator NreC